MGKTARDTMGEPDENKPQMSAKEAKKEKAELKERQETIKQEMDKKKRANNAAWKPPA